MESVWHASCFWRSVSRAILVVDDDASIRTLLVELLSSEGYQVLAAGDAYSALALIDQARPDLFLIDLQLPRMDGLELVSHLRAAGLSDVPSIFISARSRPAAIPERDFLPKPFDLEDVVAAVETRLGAPQRTWSRDASDMAAGGGGG